MKIGEAESNGPCLDPAWTPIDDVIDAKPQFLICRSGTAGVTLSSCCRSGSQLSPSGRLNLRRRLSIPALSRVDGQQPMSHVACLTLPERPMICYSQLHEILMRHNLFLLIGSRLPTVRVQDTLCLFLSRLEIVP